VSLTLRPIAHSEIGLVRKTNQDSGYVSASTLIVADGMGGAAAGDLASGLAIHDLCHVDDVPVAGEDALEALKEYTYRANDDIARLIGINPTLDGMGTTICGGIFDGSDLNIVHIGDSRGYLLSGGVLTRLTHDHSYVQSLIDEGRLGEKEAMNHPHRSLLLKVLNGQPGIQPDFFSVEVHEGDRIMFCSDGLCGLVDDTIIGTVMQLPDPADVMSTLVELAHIAGGTDNITVILADVVEETGQESGPAPVQNPDSRPATDGAGSRGPGDSVPGKMTTVSGGTTEPNETTQPDETAEPRGTAEPNETTQPNKTTEPNETTQPNETAEPGGAAVPSETAGSIRMTAETDGNDSEMTVLIDNTIQEALPVPYPSSGLIGAAADPRIVSMLDVLADLGPADTSRPAARPAPAPKLTSAEQERRRYTPRTKRSHKGLFLIVAAILVVLGGAGWGVYAYVSSQFFVGAADGRVAIYQGLPGTVAGIDTSKVYETTTIDLTDLPLSWRDKVTATIPTSGLDQARTSVQEIRTKAQQCRTERANRPPGSQPSADGC